MGQIIAFDNRQEKELRERRRKAWNSVTQRAMETSVLGVRREERIQNRVIRERTETANRV